MKLKKIILFIRSMVLATLFVLLILTAASCSSQKYTMRKIDDVNKAAEVIKRKPNDRKTIAKLLDAAEYGNSSVRAEALWVLAEAEIEEGYELYLRYANNDPSFNVRQMAVRAIGRMPSVDSQGIEKIRVAITDTSLPVQIEALEMAGNLQKDELVAPMMKSLTSSNRWVKMAAISSLKDYEGQNINKALTSIRDSEADKAIAATAAEVMEYRESIGLV